jgi:hypothetical protein
VKFTESFQRIAVAVPATATDLYTQPTAGWSALLVIDTKAAANEWSCRSFSSAGGGGGGTAAGGAAAGGAALWGAATWGAAAGGSAAGGAATWGAAAGGSAAGGAVESGVHHPVAMGENPADHGVLVPVVPPGAVPGSPDPDMISPTAAINAEAAMRTPGRRYRGGGAASSWRE